MRSARFFDRCLKAVPRCQIRKHGTNPNEVEPALAADVTETDIMISSDDADGRGR